MYIYYTGVLQCVFLACKLFFINMRCVYADEIHTNRTKKTYMYFKGSMNLNCSLELVNQITSMIFQLSVPLTGVEPWLA